MHVRVPIVLLYSSLQTLECNVIDFLKHCIRYQEGDQPAYRPTTTSIFHFYSFFQVLVYVPMKSQRLSYVVY
jgi:hypothetical protein